MTCNCFRRLSVVACVAVLGSMVLASTSHAVVVARAISAAGDLNVTTYNSDVDGDMFPNADVDAGFGAETGPDSFADAMSVIIPGDMFGISNQAADPFTMPLPAPGIPFALVDDSAAIFTGDMVGIIKSGDDGFVSGTPLPTDSDPFFGVADTVNDDQDGRNPTQVASWTFDLSGATLSGGFTVSIDMAAMGDFETNDVFLFEISTDGGTTFSPIFEPIVDDEGMQTYILQSGTEVMLNDPVTLNGTLLSNEFQTFTASVSGTPSSAILQFRATADGGTEAFAFRNVLIDDSFVAPTEDADFNNDGVVNVADYTLWRDNLGGPGPVGDADGMNGVTVTDYEIWKSQFGGAPPISAITANAVPEPASALAMGVGLLAAVFGLRREAK